MIHLLKAMLATALHFTVQIHFSYTGVKPETQYINSTSSYICYSQFLFQSFAGFSLVRLLKQSIIEFKRKKKNHPVVKLNITMHVVYCEDIRYHDMKLSNPNIDILYTQRSG